MHAHTSGFFLRLNSVELPVWRKDYSLASKGLIGIKHAFLSWLWASSLKSEFLLQLVIIFIITDCAPNKNSNHLVLSAASIMIQRFFALQSFLKHERHVIADISTLFDSSFHCWIEYADCSCDLSISCGEGGGIASAVAGYRWALLLQRRSPKGWPADSASAVGK